MEQLDKNCPTKGPGGFFFLLIRLLQSFWAGRIFIMRDLIFDFSVKGSLLDYLAISFLGASCFTSLALLCSSKGKNSSAYSGFVNLIVIFLMLFSGIWFNRNNFPAWLQDLSFYSPLSALVDSLRKISLEGDSLFFLSQYLLKWHRFWLYFLAMLQVFLEYLLYYY